LHQVLLQSWQECSKNSQNACEDTFSQTQTYDWLKWFKNGQTSVDDQRPGRSSVGTTLKNVAKVHEVIRQDHR